MVACSKSSSSRITATAQSNSHGDNFEVILTQSSSGNIQSQRRVVEQKYWGNFTSSIYDGLGNQILSFSEKGYYDAIYIGGVGDASEHGAWTVGNELFMECIDYEIFESAIRKIGTFTDVNTFVVDTVIIDMDLVFSGLSIAGRGAIFKRE